MARATEPSVSTRAGSSSTPLVTAEPASPKKRKVPKEVQMKNRATSMPQSPTRLTMKAFFPAEAAEGRVNQKPIRR